VPVSVESTSSDVEMGNDVFSDAAPIDDDEFWIAALVRRPAPRRRRHRLLLGFFALAAFVGLGTFGVAIAQWRGTDGIVEASARARHDAPSRAASTTAPTLPALTTTTEAILEQPPATPTPPPTPTPMRTPSATPAATAPAVPAPEPEPALSPSPAPPPEPGPAGLTGAILSAMNADRAANGLGPLGWHSGLAGYAQNWANWMAQNMSLTHQDLSPMRSLGLNAVGENLLVGPSGMSAATIESAWMNSPDHRENILNAAFTVAGVATAISADGRLWIAVDFGG
jgi:uncharacterized protein YkwD